MKRYQVKSWENDEVLAEYDSLAPAKKHCKELGYMDTRKQLSYSIFTGYPPIAYVWDNKLSGLIYNPRFKKDA